MGGFFSFESSLINKKKARVSSELFGKERARRDRIKSKD